MSNPSSAATSRETSVSMSSSAAASGQTLAVLIRDHKANMNRLRGENERAFKQCSISAAAASTALVSCTNKDTLEIFSTEHRIESQIKDLMVASEGFQKRLAQWSAMFMKFDHALKELGDVTHWAGTIEATAQQTISILDEISKQKRRAMGIEK